MVVCVCIYLHLYILSHKIVVCTVSKAHTHAHIYTHIYTHTHTHTYNLSLSLIHTRTHTHTHTHTHTRTHTHTLTLAHAYTYTHTHTHTQRVGTNCSTLQHSAREGSMTRRKRNERVKRRMREVTRIYEINLHIVEMTYIYIYICTSHLYAFISQMRVTCLKHVCYFIWWLRWGWVFLERTRILSGVQFTRLFIEFMFVEIICW